ncbi:PAS domain S-box protein [Peribacillus sp. SCS-26]|uniref:PAS domain S-box protein n=1 Tax=Paraperibacillus marinus TaxID=3115295 RepID=UPI0039067F4A
MVNIQELFSFISEKSQNIISILSADGVFTYISPTVKNLLGYSADEVIGKPAASFNPPDTNRDWQDYRDSLFIDTNTFRFTGRVRHKNGDYRWYETTAEVIRDRSGNIIQTICVGRDITDRKQAEEELASLVKELSSPVIPIFDGILVIPLIGKFTRERMSDLIHTALTHASNGKADTLLLDVTGYTYEDDSPLAGMQQLITSIRLLGTECFIVGISPELAIGLIRSEINLSGIRTFSTLQKGIEFCLQRERER